MLTYLESVEGVASTSYHITKEPKIEENDEITTSALNSLWIWGFREKTTFEEMKYSF